MQGLLNNHLQQRKANILAAFGVNIVKSNMNDLNKSHGEGSRGGNVIGHTKSGHPIYSKEAPVGTHNVTKNSNGTYAYHVKTNKGTSRYNTNGKDENMEDEETAHSVHENIGEEGGYTHKNVHEYLTATRQAGGGNVKHEKDNEELKSDKAYKNNIKSRLKQHLNNDEEHFYSVVGKHYEPSDDGESEHTMLQNLSKHKNVNKILSQLGKKK